MTRTRGSTLAIVACLFGLLAVGSTLHAIFIAREPTPVTPFLAPPRHPLPYTTKSVDMKAFTAAVEANPFHPQRQRGAAFVLPSEQIEAPVAEMPLEPAGAVQLIGTGQVAAGRDFVICQFDLEHPRLVHVGDMCGDRTLRTVRNGQAEFVDREGRAEVLFVPGRESQ